jgi:hypothetical protein
MMRALARTADARRQQGRPSDAVRLYQRALELCDTACGPDGAERHAILKGLALAEAAVARESPG